MCNALHSPILCIILWRASTPTPFDKWLHRASHQMSASWTSRAAHNFRFSINMQTPRHIFCTEEQSTLKTFSHGRGVSFRWWGLAFYVVGHCLSHRRWEGVLPPHARSMCCHRGWCPSRTSRVVPVWSPPSRRSSCCRLCRIGAYWAPPLELRLGYSIVRLSVQPKRVVPSDDQLAPCTWPSPKTRK